MSEPDNEIAPDLGVLTPPQLTAEYNKWRNEYRTLARRAKKVSRGSGGIYVEGNRLAYAATLFTRITVIAFSVERLLPNCAPREHWDFSSVASLARNLSEAYLWYFWLCEDDVDDDVRQGRFVLLYCHDHGSRKRLFGDEGPEKSDEKVMADLIERFDNNPYLKTLPEQKRKELLKGYKTPFVQDEVLDRMKEDKGGFRLWYRFFSQHVHTGPLSFFRMAEHDRGSGVETMHEKRYMILALMFAAQVLERAISGHLKLFPEAENRAPFLTDAQVIRNVETNQWRNRKRGHRDR